MWLDNLVALKYTCMINGVTQVVMTKADVLDSFEELNVCTAYKVNGELTQEVPYQMSKVKIEPIYKGYKGWNTDTTKITDAASLPANMSTYIEFINQYINTPVKYVSNGPGREQIVTL